VKLDVGLGIQDGASTARRMALAILPAYVLAAIVGMVSAAYASANFASILALLAPYPFLALAGAIFYRRAFRAEAQHQLLPSALILLIGEILVQLLFLILLFLMALLIVLVAGIFVGASGADFTGIETSDALVDAFQNSLSLPAVIVLVALMLAAFLALGWIAVRLSLWGAATVFEGRLLIFQTWGWTRAEAVKLVVMALPLFVLPLSVAFVLVLLVEARLDGVLDPFAPTTVLLSEGLSWVVGYPVYLLGHGYAVAGLRQLSPQMVSAEDAFS